MSIVSKSSWECIALGGERVKHGENYVPGPDYCTACKCEKGEAKFCRAALCQPPQDCKSFRVGNSCCDFICLDDILPTRNNNGAIGPSDAGLRMVASAITAILSVALFFFLIHRLRQRKLRTAQHQYFEDQFESQQDSCRSNACCYAHNALYLSGNDHVDLFLDGYTPPYSPWKPPAYSVQPREPPPSYSEVVALDRNRPSSLPSLNPLMAELTSSFPLAHRVSLRNSIVVSEALSVAGPSGIQRESTILSDQVYSGIHSYPQSALPLNDLNKGAEGGASISSIIKTAAVAKESIHTNCKCSVQKVNCSSCSSAAKDIARTKLDLSVGNSSNINNSVEEFRLHLQLDLSDSSPSNSSSNPMSSQSVTSSEDTPSVASPSETNC